MGIVRGRVVGYHEAMRRRRRRRKMGRGILERECMDDGAGSAVLLL